MIKKIAFLVFSVFLCVAALAFIYQVMKDDNGIHTRRMLLTKIGSGRVYA
jgi:hypothetical protein